MLLRMWATFSLLWFGVVVVGYLLAAHANNRTVDGLQTGGTCRPVAIRDQH
jgi:hypothetical protein